MEDQSLFTNSQSKVISEGLQNFIDSMVEEIVLEGKPFNTQKKYLKKFSENEGLDFDKLESDIITFIEVLDSLKKAFSKLQVKLAEEKGRDCHISAEMVEKLIKHSSLPKANEKTTGNKFVSKKWLWVALCSIITVGIALFFFLNDSVNVSEPTGMTEGHGWIDLGLPSGLKWATCNVGASTPSELGEGYAWGETTIKTKDEYTWQSYRFRLEGDSEDNVKLKKYNTESIRGIVDNKMKLDECDDIAHVKWGGNWRMPTSEDINELLDNCTFEWGSLDGVKGCKVTSRINGKSFFLPKTHQIGGAEYWTSTLYSSTSSGAYCLFLLPDNDNQLTGRTGNNELFWDIRSHQGGIRPVLDNNPHKDEKDNLMKSDMVLEEETSSLDSNASSLNNHAYVDLGLSVNWATCNVGANSPKDKGNIYAWGETAPKSSYTWQNYKFRVSGTDYSSIKLSKYVTKKYTGNIDNKTVLDLTDDIANVLWGNDWRIPTREEYEELLKQCTWKWTEQNGVKGYLVTSKKTGFNNRYIFLPADEESLYTTYWSSSLNIANSPMAWYVCFDSDNYSLQTMFRIDGRPVRAVCKKYR